MTPTPYAIIDRAIEQDLLENCDATDSTAWCLFEAPVDEEFAKVAPYLVQLSPQMYQWLLHQHREWGLLLTSTAPAHRLRKHFGQALSVRVEGKEQPLYCRYYDPRIFWSIVDALSIKQQHQLLAPCQKVATTFPAQREQEYGQVPTEPLPLTLTKSQYSQILEASRKALAQSLVIIFIDSGYSDNSAGKVANEITHNLPQEGISLVDDLTVFAQCMAQQQIPSWTAIPAHWLHILRDEHTPVNERVPKLKRYLGVTL